MNFLKTQLCVIAIFMATFFAITPNANAQFNFGVKVAGNFTCLDEFDVHNMDGGFDLGVFFRIGNRFYFQPEVNYSFRNADLENLLGEFRENYDMRQHFLDIPLLLNYNIINKDNFKFHITAGPRMGILMDNQLLEERTIEVLPGHMQWGGSFGVGFDIWRFTLDGRYDIAADRTSTNSGNSRVQNMFVVAVGFKFLK